MYTYVPYFRIRMGCNESNKTKRINDDPDHCSIASTGKSPKGLCFLSCDGAVISSCLSNISPSGIPLKVQVKSNGAVSSLQQSTHLWHCAGTASIMLPKALKVLKSPRQSSRTVSLIRTTRNIERSFPLNLYPYHQF